MKTNAEIDKGRVADLRDALEQAGLIDPREGADDTRMTPLTGGVSSDIWLVATKSHRFCVKRALERLKVEAVWEVPVERNAIEAAWLEQVGAWMPASVPKILAHAPEQRLFAMEYLDPDLHPVWKAELLAGWVDVAFAGRVGRDLASVHAAGAGDTDIATRFATDHLIEALRLEPYLRATAERHPDLGERLHALADATLATKRTLVHGDVSPKNILVGPKGPVFLDAECGWYGDPAFDLAFCLNHLLLKAVHRPADAGAYGTAFAALREAYLKGVDWEPVEDVEQRAAGLLPALALARVDGKSPLEYFTAGDGERTRALARPLVAEPPDGLLDVWWAFHEPAASTRTKSRT